jgi:D-beta-D-heptose 7-phosphate kinase/D-beta-D-heptose 1-phosphate adenosyltransferase
MKTVGAPLLTPLASVDMVCMLEQDTPIERVKQVKPDLLVKGAVRGG